MRQPDEVAAELLGPAEKRARVILAPRAAGARRRLFMDVNSPQDNGFPVKQNVGATDLNPAEADVVGNLISFAGDVDVIKFGIFRRPERQVSVKGKFGASFGIRLERLADVRLGNLYRDLLLELRPIKLHPA